MVFMLKILREKPITRLCVRSKILRNVENTQGTVENYDFIFNNLQLLLTWKFSNVSLWKNFVSTTDAVQTSHAKVRKRVFDKIT